MNKHYKKLVNILICAIVVIPLNGMFIPTTRQIARTRSTTKPRALPGAAYRQDTSHVQKTSSAGRQKRGYRTPAVLSNIFSIYNLPERSFMSYIPNTAENKIETMYADILNKAESAVNNPQFNDILDMKKFANRLTSEISVFADESAKANYSIVNREDPKGHTLLFYIAANFVNVGHLISRDVEHSLQAPKSYFSSHNMVRNIDHRGNEVIAKFKYIYEILYQKMNAELNNLDRQTWKNEMEYMFRKFSPNESLYGLYSYAEIFYTLRPTGFLRFVDRDKFYNFLNFFEKEKPFFISGKSPFNVLDNIAGIEQKIHDYDFDSAVNVIMEYLSRCNITEHMRRDHIHITYITRITPTFPTTFDLWKTDLDLHKMASEGSLREYFIAALDVKVENVAVAPYAQGADPILNNIYDLLLKSNAVEMKKYLYLCDNALFIKNDAFKFFKLNRDLVLKDARMHAGPKIRSQADIHPEELYTLETLNHVMNEYENAVREKTEEQLLKEKPYIRNAIEEAKKMGLDNPEERKKLLLETQAKIRSKSE